MSFIEIGVSAIAMIALDGLYLQMMTPPFSNQLMQVQGSPLALQMLPNNCKIYILDITFNRVFIFIQ